MAFDWNAMNGLADVDSPYAPAFRVALDVCKASVQSDLNNANGAHSLVFGDVDRIKQIEWGGAMADQFLIWREDVPPTLPVFLALACDYFEIDGDHPLLNVALSACILGETIHDNPFHNTHHFREVVVMTIRLAVTWNKLIDNDDLKFLPADILLLITAAAVHDFTHDGETNIRDGGHQSAYLETRAVDMAKPFLTAAGLGQSDLMLLRSLVHATDVSLDQEGDSPSRRMQSCAHKHFGQDRGEKISAPDLFINDAKLCAMAMILGEADIAPSTGLSYDFAKVLTRLIAAENNGLAPTAQTLSFFMDTICKNRCMSAACRQLMVENFTKIHLDADIDADQGVEYA